MPLTVHKQTETLHWSTSLNLHHLVRKDPPDDTHYSGFASFDRSLLAWLTVSTDEAMIRNLSLTLEDIAASTAKVIAAHQKSLDSLVKVVLGNRTALDYLLAEQRDVCAVANTACCS